MFDADTDTGRGWAIVGGNLLTACGLPPHRPFQFSIKHLARSDSRVLRIVGAGHQRYDQFSLLGITL
ncbi:hypothetical protein CN193_06280 [Sinorhizobium meliloti]|nr:hypothetical protein CN193_06280 [Sinorhizobium meliloti]